MVKKNPLNKRILRDLKSDFLKYFLTLLMLVVCIAAGFAFVLTNNSVSKTFYDGFDRYNVEDGQFVLKSKMNKAQKKIIEADDLIVYENFYIEENNANSKIRIYNSLNRESVDKLCVMSGNLPKEKYEIALDRMYAQNNNIQIGDTIKTENNTYTVSGLLAFVDYACLYESNNDVMFDAISFGIGVVSDDTFATYSSNNMSFNYVWKFKEEITDTNELKEVCEDISKRISSCAKLEYFVPRYANIAISFVGEDLVSDYYGMIFFLYILLIILAYINAITISNTIDQEAKVIGTLRAIGYSKKELLKHYLTVPIIITLIGTLIGFLLGNTILKQAMLRMYYNSYSLATYEDHYSLNVFLIVLIIPILINIVINYMVLKKKLELSPLKFLRNDLTKIKNKKIIKLSPKISFIKRFQLRVLFQNKKSYITLFLGLFLANFILLFGIAFPQMINNYETLAINDMRCKYTYMLSLPTSSLNEDNKLISTISLINFANQVETDNPDAEKFSAYSLKTYAKLIRNDDVVIYGIQKDSKYYDLDFNNKTLCISKGFADKYMVKKGETIHLKEAYEEKYYDFIVDDIVDNATVVCAYMDIDYLNEYFDLGKNFFCGYFSDSEITDIDSKYIGNTIDEITLTKLSRQLDVSMSTFMIIMQAFSILVFFVVIFLLSKTIIEKNSNNISLTKILGYKNSEINRIYMNMTAYIVVISALITIPLLKYSLMLLFEWMLRLMLAGWVPIIINDSAFIETTILGILTYLIVSFIEYQKIRKIPMTNALKNEE
ncbi:MAG: FtsX-like permease family protein [Erysipelotrichaceae bacterium]|nr:FtsX-like permease family protein [Erysipelotrichaceae bacterium]MBQ7275702.1 FtsX-like permease family protein [Bacilli bacterium]